MQIQSPQQVFQQYSHPQGELSHGSGKLSLKSPLRVIVRGGDGDREPYDLLTAGLWPTLAPRIPCRISGSPCSTDPAHSGGRRPTGCDEVEGCVASRDAKMRATGPVGSFSVSLNTGCT